MFCNTHNKFTVLVTPSFHLQGHPDHHREAEACSASVHSGVLDSHALAGPGLHLHALPCGVTVGGVLAAVWTQHILHQTHLSNASQPSFGVHQDLHSWGHVCTHDKVILNTIYINFYISYTTGSFPKVLQCYLKKEKNAGIQLDATTLKKIHWTAQYMHLAQFPLKIYLWYKIIN